MPNNSGLNSLERMKKMGWLHGNSDRPKGPHQFPETQYNAHMYDYSIHMLEVSNENHSKREFKAMVHEDDPEACSWYEEFLSKTMKWGKVSVAGNSIVLTIDKTQKVCGQDVYIKYSQTPESSSWDDINVPEVSWSFANIRVDIMSDSDDEIVLILQKVERN